MADPQAAQEPDPGVVAACGLKDSPGRIEDKLLRRKKNRPCFNAKMHHNEPNNGKTAPFSAFLHDMESISLKTADYDAKMQ